MRPPRCALAPQRCVPVVLDGILRPARAGGRRPPRAQHAMPLHQDALLFRRPLTASDVGLEVVEPPIAALLPRRPSILPASKLHFRCPCSSTSLRSKLSSCNVHCCVEPLNARCEPPVLAGVSGLSLSSPPSVAPEAAFPDVEAFAAFAALAPGLGPRGDPAAFVDAAAFFAGAAPFLSGTIPFRSSFDAACARKNGEEGDKGSAGATGGAVKNIPRVARETNVLGRYC